MSIESKKRVKEMVTGKLEEALNKLYRIWNDIGIDQSQVTNRADTVSEHLRNLLDEMVKEEEQLRDSLAANIQEFEDEMYHLCSELALPVSKVTENLSMVQKEKELKMKLEHLKRERGERMKKLKHLQEQDQHLCDALCSTPYYVPSNSTPSREQLQQLEAHVRTLQAEKAKRYEEFQSVKEKIVALCTEMDYDPETSFVRDLVCEDDDSFTLSTENMESLRTALRDLEHKHQNLRQQVEDQWQRIHNLWNRLELPESERREFEVQNRGHKHSVLSGLQSEILRCEQLKYANLQRFVDGARRELVEQWNRCYFSKEQRDNFLPFLDETYSEQLLEVHEQELVRMQEYYQAHKEVLDLMARREKLWKDMLEFEKNASDPNRFFNDRGGRLLREEKARVKLMKELPKVEEEAKEQIDAWERRTGKQFRIEGVSFTDYIERQWTTFRMQKDQEKQERQKIKARQMEEEMIFGSKPTMNTPGKRRFMNTTTNRTPLKSRKLNETPRTPASVSRIQHSSVFPSPYSRMPLSASKTPNMNHTQRRRSLRQARKVLQEKMQNANTNTSRGGRKKSLVKAKPDLFSQTTVSGGGSDDNISLATMGSYKDFAARLKSTSSSPGNSTLLSVESNKSKKSTASSRSGRKV